MNKRYLKILSGLGLGAILGFSYYYFIGCVSGTCAISSNPFISTAYGAMLGLLFFWPTAKTRDKSKLEGGGNEK